MKRLVYTIVLLSGLLAACNQGERPTPSLESLALTFSNIQWLTDIATNTQTKGPFSRIVDENCMTNALNAPGQGYRAAGSDGGLTYDSGLAGNLGITTANKVGIAVKGLLGAPQRNMTLLIVDDFRSGGVPSSGVYAPKLELFTQTSLNGATLAQLQDNKKLSHGALVLQHTLDTIKGTGLYPFNTSPSPGVTVFRTTSIIGRTTRLLTVKAIDTGLASTSIIANSVLSSTIATKLVAPLDTSAGTVVINMSFALLPCEAYADFLQWDKITRGEQRFDEYIAALAVKNNVGSEELIKVLVEATNDTSDPLYQTIKNNWLKNVFAAASGNYGFNKTATYPAKWTGVINTTGSAANNTSIRNSTFNRGEIMDIAGSLKLTAPSIFPNAKHVYYKGTSFSTPTLSVYSALDLAGQRRCTQVSTNPSNGSTFIVPRLAINSLNLTDSPLASAVSQLCPTQ